jgi:hypothetical protein
LYEEAVNPESAKDFVRYPAFAGLFSWEANRKHLPALIVVLTDAVEKRF